MNRKKDFLKLTLTSIFLFISKVSLAFTDRGTYDPNASIDSAVKKIDEGTSFLNNELIPRIGFVITIIAVVFYMSGHAEGNKKLKSALLGVIGLAMIVTLFSGIFNFFAG